MEAIDAMRELIDAVNEYVPSVPAVDAMCHRGICAQAECGNCSRIIRVRVALAAMTGVIDELQGRLTSAEDALQYDE